MFLTNCTIFIAFQGQDSMKIIGHSTSSQFQPEQSLTQFVNECLQPYRDMINNNKIYPKRLRNKLRTHIRYIEAYALMIKLGSRLKEQENQHGPQMSQKLQEAEQIAQELDKSIS